MTTYITRQIQLAVSEQQNGQGQIFSRGNNIQTRFEAVAGLEEAEMKKYVIPIPTVDKDLLEGSTIASARILMIETDTEITVKLDAVGDTGFIVKPVVEDDSATKKGTLYLEGEFTHVYVSVAGASGSANVIMGVVGA